LPRRAEPVSASSWWRRRQADKPELLQSDGRQLEGVLNSAGKRGYQLTIVDSAPHNSAAAKSCASLSDLILIPTRPAILDLDAIGATTQLVDKMGTAANIVLNACPPPTRYGEPHIVKEAREALQVYNLPVCDVALSQRAAFSHALIDGRSIAEYDHKSKAAQEINTLWDSIKRELAL